MRQTINGADFRRLVISAAAGIEINKQKLNDLNVFPVPDGDTGTNMSMTINAAASDLRKLEDPSLEQAGKAAASAMLRGARGNSGVILSLLFRGISKKLKGVKVQFHEDNTISIDLHIIVDNGVNLNAVGASIISEVKYVVTSTTGTEVRALNVYIDSMMIG